MKTFLRVAAVLIVMAMAGTAIAAESGPKNITVLNIGQAGEGAEYLALTLRKEFPNRKVFVRGLAGKDDILITPDITTVRHAGVITAISVSARADVDSKTYVLKGTCQNVAEQLKRDLQDK